MKKLIVGNWKMNETIESAVSLMKGIADGIESEPSLLEGCGFLVCPSFLHMGAVKDIIQKTNVSVFFGGQDCADTNNGAYTGQISAKMLNDMGCGYVIVGHSERREYQEESDQLIAAKASRAHENGLISVICVGEREKERDAGYERDIVERQLEKALPQSATAKNTVIAYEPVWAIGTGKSATPADIGVMHQFIRDRLQKKLAESTSVRILYGGSVKPDNACAIFDVENVDGALIGCASLKAGSFIAIAQAALKA